MRTVVRWFIAAVVVLVVVGMPGPGSFPHSEARGGIWTVNVFGNADLSGAPLWVGSTNSINYSWGAGAPTIGGVVVPGAPVDNFSVAFETNIFFTAGTYTFTATVDDGARVYVSGVPVIAGWQAAGLRTLTANYSIPADGNQIIRVEMFDLVGDATIQFGWQLAGSGGGICTEGYGLYTACPSGSSPGSSGAPVGWPPTSGPHAICADGWNSCSNDASGACSSHGGVLYWCTGGTTGGGTGTTWYAEYFANLDLSGAAVFTSTLAASGINQNWGEGSPGGSVPADNWSARFTRQLNVPNDLAEGMYIFYARADDNYRFTIDQTVIFDRWDSYGNSSILAIDVPLLPGPHTFKFEYRDQTSGAEAFLTWSPPSAQNPALTIVGQTIPVEGIGGTLGGGTTGVPTTGGTTGGQVAVPVSVTATVNVPTLNVRGAPTTAAAIITRVTQGAVYTAVGRSADNVWVFIQVDASTVGWVYAQYVALSGDINALSVNDTTVTTPVTVAPTGVRARALGNLRIRQGPSTRTPKIGLLTWGTEVDVLGRSFGNVWFQVAHDGAVGWVYSPYMRVIEGAVDSLVFTDGTDPAVPPPVPTTGVVIQAFGNMRIRSGPSFNYPQINKIQWGTRVQVLARDATGYWLKIQYGPVIGWSYGAWYRTVQGDVSTVPIAEQ